MYLLELTLTADKAFRKLAKKDMKQLRRVKAKIEDILENPYRFKPLRAPLDGLRHVHVGSFVIVFEIDEKPGTVIILDYDHHDNIYRT